MKSIQRLVLLYGSYKVAQFGYDLTAIYQNHYMREPTDLKLTYGSGYAIITGENQLSKAYAEAFAQNNIDLILVGSEAYSLQNQQESLQTQYNIKVQTLQHDFSNENPEYQKKLSDFLKSYDISFYVDNSRLHNFERANTIDKNLVKDMIFHNNISPLMMQKELIPHLRQQKHKCAVLTVASQKSQGVYRGSVNYATEAYMHMMSKGLQMEFDMRNIDYKLILPWEFNPEDNQQKNDMGFVCKLFTEDPLYFAQQSLRKLDYDQFNSGSQKHTVLYYLTNKFPQFAELVNKF